MAAGRSNGTSALPRDLSNGPGAWHANEENLFFSSENKSLPLTDFNLYSEQEFTRAAHDGKTIYADAMKRWEKAQAAEVSGTGGGKEESSNSGSETEERVESTKTTSNISPKLNTSSSTRAGIEIQSGRNAEDFTTKIAESKSPEPSSLQPEKSPQSLEEKKFFDPKRIYSNSGSSSTGRDMSPDVSLNKSYLSAKESSKSPQKDENLYFDPRRIFQPRVPKSSTINLSKTSSPKETTIGNQQPRTSSSAKEVRPTATLSSEHLGQAKSTGTGRAKGTGNSQTCPAPNVPSETESEQATLPKIENLHRMDKNIYHLPTENSSDRREKDRESDSYPTYIPPPEQLYCHNTDTWNEARKRKKMSTNTEKNDVTSQETKGTTSTPEESGTRNKPPEQKEPSAEQQQPSSSSDSRESGDVSKGYSGAAVLSSLWNFSKILMVAIIKVLMFIAMILLLLLSLAINLLGWIYRYAKTQGQYLWHCLGWKLGWQPEPPPSSDHNFRWSQFERSVPLENAPSQEGIIIDLPQTGEEAISRLLSVGGRDPYTVLGVGRNSSEKDIKKAYRKQAVLVHPDKNSLPGTEEAFKILGSAFEILGDPGTRQEYDSQKLTDEQAEELLRSFSESVKDFATRLKEAANTLQCTKCGGEHKRTVTDRHDYFARFCSQCNTKHPAKEGDVWAETSMLGFRLHFYACMDKMIYDVSDWASCQGLARIRANSHVVQVRIGVDKSSRKKTTPHRSHHQPREAEMDELFRRIFREAPPPGSGSWPQTPGSEGYPGGYPGQSQNSSAQYKKKKKRRKGK